VGARDGCRDRALVGQRRLRQLQAADEPIDRYIFGAYTQPGTLFPGSDGAYFLQDTHALSHEVAEWVDDGFVNNFVDPWLTPTAPQYGCTSYLETGDPIVAIGFTLPGERELPERRLPQGAPSPAQGRIGGAGNAGYTSTLVSTGEGGLVKHVLALIVVAGLTATTAALAAKPPPGSTDGTGRVFFPNPVAQLQDQTLTDQKDSDYPALQPAYTTVTLTNLDGSGFLRGDWATVVGSTGPLAYSATNTFLFGRDNDRFEQVMAYYWVTEAQKYIQDLGFGTTRRPINEESQDIRINQWGVDNSFSWDKKDLLRFGKGGVDDAEDAEVILHEYGHAIQDSQQTPLGFGFSTEARSIGEGFADYLAVTVSDVIAPTPDEPCVADWDSVSYTSTVPHCLRRVDEDLTYPDDLNGGVHHDGQIWSRALWDIRQALDNVKADTIILEAQFDIPDPTMPELAQRTVDTAQSLYGSSEANAVETAFKDRGIL
jgi:hypothetical protein